MSKQITQSRKEYKFSNGLECYQEELTLEQEHKLLDLFEQVQLDEKDINNINFYKILFKKRIIYKVLSIILNSNDNTISVNKFESLKNSELLEVLEDFFILNPLLKELSMNITKNQDLQSVISNIGSSIKKREKNSPAMK